MGMTFPNETPAYRDARDTLLRRELALRRSMEAVAAELRALPQGGEVPEDYLFERMRDGGPEPVRMSELFRGRDTLMLYHYMFPRHSGDDRPGPSRGALSQVPLRDGPCPSCTALIDGWDSTMPHFEGLGGNLAIVVKAPIGQAAAFAAERGWTHTRLLSTAGNNFCRDYGGDGADGEPVPIMTVFRRGQDGIVRLHWASELIGEAADPGQDPRALGTVEPLWTLFDLTPAGRPARDELLDYHCCERG